MAFVSALRPTWGTDRRPHGKSARVVRFLGHESCRVVQQRFDLRVRSRLNVIRMDAQQSSPSPKLHSQVFSLATLNRDGSTNMNIVTYVTPVSIHPQRLWALSLFVDTQSHENFTRSRVARLQLLCKDHARLVPLLGKQSGRHVNKVHELARMGVELENVVVPSEKSLEDNPAFALQVLPGIQGFVDLRWNPERQVSRIPCGDHDLFICALEYFHACGPDEQEDNTLHTDFLAKLTSD
ncbi:hypothetical protein FVE85_0711 [Porphyridium purpureum]|uniref:Flavin reductase like domain-containing protein n=1 Tax=Porphyridium purpureum TaxID=35688 RepID=A0A5J4Z1F6_PORPP|nr:hypothetical protein FVE85_0711 [Porphyridium purpureum]|eukprot:POR2472..scf208_2